MHGSLYVCASVYSVYAWKFICICTCFMYVLISMEVYMYVRVFIGVYARVLCMC